VEARAAVAPTASFAVAATNELVEVTQCEVKATTTVGTMEAVVGETAMAIFPKQSKVHRLKSTRHDSFLTFLPVDPVQLY
jgi:hypothetical protein